MKKFVENAIAKQNEAYNLSYAKKNYLYSCDYCVSHNCLRCDCEACPVTLAYKTAIEEINKGLRKKPQTKKVQKGHVSVYISNSSNITVTINEK